MGDNLTAYQRSLIRMWDSLRTEYKGELACTGVKCAVCPVFEDCSKMGGPTRIIDAERAIQNVREWEKKNGTRKCSDIKLEELKQHCIRTIELCERYGGMVGDDRRRQEHEMVLELIEEHEQRQENETWIPVSKREPKKAGRYLAKIINKQGEVIIMTCDYFMGKNLITQEKRTVWGPDDILESNNVVEWRPLPEQ